MNDDLLEIATEALCQIRDFDLGKSVIAARRLQEIAEQALAKLPLSETDFAPMCVPARKWSSVPT